MIIMTHQLLEYVKMYYAHQDIEIRACIAFNDCIRKIRIFKSQIYGHKINLMLFSKSYYLDDKKNKSNLVQYLEKIDYDHFNQIDQILKGQPNIKTQQKSINISIFKLKNKILSQ